MQKTIRMARRSVIGGGLGGGIGLLCGLVLGIVFHMVKRQPEGFRLDTFWTMALIGFVIGGALGAAVVVVRDMVREE